MDCILFTGTIHLYTSQKTMNSALKNLHSSVFETAISQPLLSEWAKRNNGSSFQYISRWEYAKLWDALVSQEEGKTIISLPIDLQFHELLSITCTLERFFWLEHSGNVTSLAQKIKTLIHIVLRHALIDKKDLEDAIRGLHIPQWCILKVENARIPVSHQTEEILNTALNIQDSESDIPEHLQQYIKVFEGVLLEHFLSLFTQHGSLLLREWLTTFTRDEFDALQQKVHDGEYHWVVREQVFWAVEKKEVNIKTHKQHHTILPRNLVSVLWIEKYKKRLKEVREWNNQAEVTRLEREVAGKIAKEVFKYPRIKSALQTPLEILKSKHMCCLGNSILWNTLFDLLGIENFCVVSSNHIFLTVVIGWIPYLFDPTVYDDIISKGTPITRWKMYQFETQDGIDIYFTRDAQKELTSNILVNMWNHFFDTWDAKMTQNILELALKINPQSSVVYFNLAHLYLLAQDYWRSLDNYFKYLSFNPLCYITHNNIAHVSLLIWDINQAIVKSIQAIEIDPSNWYWWRTLWEIFEHIEKKEESSICYYVSEFFWNTDSKNTSTGLPQSVKKEIDTYIANEDLSGLLKRLFWETIIQIIQEEVLTPIEEALTSWD